LFLFSLISAFSYAAYAQDETVRYVAAKNSIDSDRIEEKVSLELGLNISSPLGDYKNTYSKDAIYGGRMAAFIPLTKFVPVDLGVSLGMDFMGYQELSDKVIKDGYEADLKIRTSGFIVPFHFVVRYYPFKIKPVKFQPYLEGIIGTDMHVVSHTITTSQLFVETIEEEVYSSNVLTYGGGLGAKYRISKHNLLYLNAKANYLIGGEATYLDPALVVAANGKTYKKYYKESKTENIQFLIGLHLMIE
jgi:hypothetical protein